MADNEKLLWRPNDSSPKTNLKYDLEAGHWLDSIKNATPSPTPSFGEVYGFLGLLLSFTFNIIFFIVLTLIEVVKWIIKVWPKKTPKDKYDGIPTFDNRPKLTNEEVMEIIRKADESGVIEEIDFN